MKKLALLKETLKHMEYHNNMAPFPVFDTENVSDLKDYIKIMERTPNEYDNLPTACCKHCLDLGIMVDEFDNDICVRCGSINEIIVFDTYEKYDEFLNSTLNENC